MPIANLKWRAASSTGQVLNPEAHGKSWRLYFSLQLAGNYPGDPGEPFDLTTLFSAAVAPPGFSYPSGSLPEKIELQSIKAGGGSTLFQYEYSPGATPTLVNGTIQVFTGAAAQSGLAQLNAGAYPAGVTGDTIEGEIIIPRL